MSDEKRGQQMLHAEAMADGLMRADEYDRARWLRWKWLRDLFPHQPEIGPLFAYDGRCLSVEQFKAHVTALPARTIAKIVVHHTYSPNAALWAKYGGVYWLKNMEAYYRSHYGWASGPHGYIADEGIWMFWTMEQDGIHAGRVGNVQSWGWEIVGDYQTSLPAGKTLDNSAWAFAIMLKKAGLSVGAGLKKHRDYLATACPGNKLAANWSWYCGEVQKRLDQLVNPESPDPPAPTDIEVLQAKVAAHGRLIVELEQANRDRMADIADINQDLQSQGAVLEDHEGRIAALEAMNGDGK